MQSDRMVWRAVALATALTAALWSAAARATEIDFEDLPSAGSPLPAGYPGSQWYGVANYNDPPTASSFTSGGVTFHNTRQYAHSSWPPPNGSDMDVWEGWAYSSRSDTTTTGLPGQFTALGSGVAGQNGAGASAQYAVAYPVAYNGTDLGINFAKDTVVTGAYFTNVSYVADILANGDPINHFARAFHSGDYFKLTVTGYDGANAAVGSADFYLADYRDGKSFIAKDWTWADLSGLGKPVRRLEFGLESTDSGDFGMNTPSYFAMDGLTVVPEPSTLALLVMGGLAVMGWRWRRKS